MAISDYSELQTAVANALGRSASSMPQGNVTDYIAQGEAYLNRQLRLNAMINEATLSLTSGTSSVSLPAGFVESVDLRFSADNARPTQLSIVDFVEKLETSSGQPRFFKVGSAIDFERNADATYGLKLIYYKGWDIASDDTNWLLTNAPDCYLNASLRFAYADIRNLDEEKKSIDRVAKSISELNTRDQRSTAKAQMSVDAGLRTRRKAYQDY